VHSARGSSGKAADADVSWAPTKTELFDRETVGRIKLEHHGADRDGHLPPLVEFEMGDGEGNLTVRRVEPERKTEGRHEAKRDAFAQLVSDPGSPYFSRPGKAAASITGSTRARRRSSSTGASS